MLGECIGNTPAHLQTDLERKTYAHNIHQDRVNLIIGAHYRIFGICYQTENGIPWYLVCEEINDSYPTAHLGVFFKIIDGLVPEGWSFSATAGNIGDTAILPTTWANDPAFLEKLVDGEPNAAENFRNMKNSSTKGP
jgi:hypothetical protein